MTVRSESASPDRLHTIRVGVTGHRPGALTAADYPLLRAQIRKVLTSLSDVAAGRPAIVVTSLAAGADQLVAEEALVVGHSLQCPLPFDRDEYVRDFVDENSRKCFLSLLAQASSVEELAGSRSTKQDEITAYAAAGKRVLAAADLLLAIWDGKPGRGEGGTFDVVTWARERHVPIVWISSVTPHEVQVVSGGELSGSIGGIVARIRQMIE